MEVVRAISFLLLITDGRDKYGKNWVEGKDQAIFIS